MRKSGRNEDVLLPVKKYVDQAFFIMLPFHGVEKESEKIKAVESGALNKMVKVLQECNWRMLAERMEKVDSVLFNLPSVIYLFLTFSNVA